MSHKRCAALWADNSLMLNDVTEGYEDRLYIRTAT